MSDFPADDVLIARGKYSTLAGERRDALKRMRDGLEGMVNCAGRVLRRPDDLELMAEELVNAKRFISGVQDTFGQLLVLHTHLEELKPLAWGKEKAEHE